MELQERSESPKEKSQREVRDEILTETLGFSDRHFDPSAKEKVKKLIGVSDEEVRKPLLFLLDDCVYGSLCSGQLIGVLDTLYRLAGGSDKEMQSWMPEREDRHG